VIPAFLNPNAGNAEAAGQLLAADSRFALQTLSPAALPQAIQAAMQSGAQRILVAGGDGTLATAARTLLSYSAELAILPAGTRNHFAKSLGLPTHGHEALEIAVGSGIRTVDVAMVNAHIFLNTSSVGAYITLVRRRQRLQSYVGQSMARVLSAAGLLLGVQSISLELVVEGRRQRYQTPLFFVGVGERDLNSPTVRELIGVGEHDLKPSSLGERVGPGDARLHVVVVRSQGRARLLMMALATAVGLQKTARTRHLDSFLVEHCRIEMPRRTAQVALDGEILSIKPPLEYRLLRNALRVVAPPTGAATLPDQLGENAL
jgi:diacylglycerol kinase family enzyme